MTSKIEFDLAKSGLQMIDIRARALDDLERTSCNVHAGVQGYVIPYFDIKGMPIPYYRLKLFDFHIKYKQVKNTPNHVYFPINFMEVFLKQNPSRRYVIMTEGEKKAALLCKLGIPCVAFGGVDSWRNRIITLPADAEISKGDSTAKTLSIKIPTGYAEDDLSMSPLARGFQELVDLCKSCNVTMIICYDTDKDFGMKPEVQRAAATLAYELRYKGFQLTKIKQLVLPMLPSPATKTALDDFVIQLGVDKLRYLIGVIYDKKKAFPRNPNIREHVGKVLSNPRCSRKDLQQLSLAVISELDARGQRMHSPDSNELYFFDSTNAKLMRSSVNTISKDQLQETGFGKLLYNDYGISPAADQRLMQWIGSQFAAEDPVEDVKPHRVLARMSTLSGDFDFMDCINYQINDSQFARVSKDGITILDNGTENILFEVGSVQPLDASTILTEFERLTHQYGDPTDLANYPLSPVTNRWNEVLKEVRLKYRNEPAYLSSLLMHISPWLFRWRGTQLPVELIIGESGSGKSSLMELRLDVLTGNATLRNAPADIKDWHASVANTGGLHVIDNVQMTDKQMGQRLSDEICRLITEPNPRIEMRKYYTNTELMQVPVEAVFAFTAIKQPFVNADLLQRAVILEFDKALPADSEEALSYDSRWRFSQIERYGGRHGWIAYHLYVIHRFFHGVAEVWNPTYKASHRLINFEQSLVVLAKSVFDVDPSWIPNHLVRVTNAHVTDADWAFEGLCAFADLMRDAKKTGIKHAVSAADIVSWAVMNDEYSDCGQITNARKLGRYMATHKFLLGSVAKIYEVGTKANKMMYEIK